MKILIAAATEKEGEAIQNALIPYSFSQKSIEYLITGPSVPLTMYTILEYLNHTPPADLYLNVGICGSFRPDWKPGTVLEIVSDCFGDIEIQERNDARSLFEAGFLNPDEFPFSGGRIVNHHSFQSDLPKATAITVNSTSGKEEQIAERIRRFNPDTESMEGAAFAYVCEKKSLKYRQIRAVSNVIKRRDMQVWDIHRALEELGKSLAKLLRN